VACDKIKEEEEEEELDFFQIFLPYSFRLIGPQTKHSQIQPW
jgi:hypothetical protein